MAENTRDVAGIALAGSALHEVADIDVIVARRLRSSSIAQRYVAVATGVVEEREITDGHIAETSCIAAECFVSERVVALHDGICKRLETNSRAEPCSLGRAERLKAYRRIRAGLSVLVERRGAERRVRSFLAVTAAAGSATYSVVRQRAGADSRVAACGIGEECLMTDRCIVVAGAVKEQGPNADTGVVIAGRVELER